MPAQRCSKCGDNFKTATAPKKKKSLISRFFNYAIVCASVVLLVYLGNRFYQDIKSDPTLSINSTGETGKPGNSASAGATGVSGPKKADSYSIRDYLFAPYYDAERGVVSVRRLNVRNAELGEQIEQITDSKMEYVYRPEGAQGAYMSPEELIESYETATRHNEAAIQDASQ
jgi:hypothetical protein